MRHTVSDWHNFSVKLAAILIALAGAGLLSSCSTTPGYSSATEPAFRFRVLRYVPPIQAAEWNHDPALDGDPEGAALNIATAMQQGNVELWLSHLEASDRPNVSEAERRALLQQWQTMRDSKISVLGRIIAGADVVVELELVNPQSQTQTLQFPLKKVDDRWCLAAMDPSSEYLNWETSGNKIVDNIDPNALKQHLAARKGKN